MLPEFSKMTVKELREYAKDNNIDLQDAKKKDDILLVINKYYEEDSTMEELNVNQELEVKDEMEVKEEVATEVPAEVTEEKKIWKDAEGNEVSMSQFIREQFTKFNKSRKAISEEFGINYRTVYGATVNMENEAEPASRGRGVVNPKIAVTADNKVFASKVEGEGEAAVTKYFLNGEEITAEEAAGIETVETDRNSWIKDQVTAGVNRGDVAKILDLSYGVVYGLTKEEDGTRQKYEVELPDGTKIARSEYIRKRVAEGVSKSDVAKELGVEYSVVWQATKKDKSDADKLVDAVDVLAKFVDKVADPAGFQTLIDSLKTHTVKEVEVAPTEEVAAPTDSVTE